jgi:predicted anti-sigma-YlaC factor YlaD
MHREIYDHLEDVLSGAPPDSAAKHLRECDECRSKVASMAGQAALIRQLKAPVEVEPHPGFYARVLERIEAEGPVSIWNLFAESAFGKRIAVASLALALLLGIYLVSAERAAEPMVAGEPAAKVCAAPACDTATVGVPVPASAVSVVLGEDAPGAVLTRMDQEQPNDDMLVNLVTYREQ